MPKQTDPGKLVRDPMGNAQVRLKFYSNEVDALEAAAARDGLPVIEWMFATLKRAAGVERWPSR